MYNEIPNKFQRPKMISRMNNRLVVGLYWVFGRFPCLGVRTNSLRFPKRASSTALLLLIAKPPPRHTNKGRESICLVQRVLRYLWAVQYNREGPIKLKSKIPPTPARIPWEKYIRSVRRSTGVIRIRNTINGCAKWWVNCNVAWNFLKKGKSDLQIEGSNFIAVWVVPLAHRNCWFLKAWISRGILTVAVIDEWIAHFQA